jgi:prolyl-tRNA synthetase
MIPIKKQKKKTPKAAASHTFDANTVDQQSKITPRHVDYSAWYGDIIAASDMVDSSPVRGCMVIKPWGMGIWDLIKQELDHHIRTTGTQNAYFPLLIPKSFLAKEAEHVDGFAKECAVVTHHRLTVSPENNDLIPDPESKLEEPLIIRPTSETIIWNMFNKWIKSHRDLPLQVNQWANVVRWEMRTRPFLRTSEFLWQEGHTAHATQVEADTLAKHMLHVYADLCQNTLAIPTVQGEKSPSERFAGADATYTIEAQMQNGWALQSGTSHFLGQNFAKAFQVQYQISDPEDPHKNILEYVWATSWGVSTRLLGALLMTHSDDTGLVLPPRIAPIQVVVVPILPTKTADQERVTKAVEDVVQRLRAVQMGGVQVGPTSTTGATSTGTTVANDKNEWDVFAPVAPTPYTPPTNSPFLYTQSMLGYPTSLRVHVDDRRHIRPGAKYFEWERKGVPVRIEIGLRDVSQEQITVAIRFSGEKKVLSISPSTDVAKELHALLENIQQTMLDRARHRVRTQTYTVSRYAEMIELAEKEDKTGWYLAPWHCDAENEAKIKEDCKMTIRCYPWAINKQLAESGKLQTLTCFYSGKPATHMALFARAF